MSALKAIKNHIVFQFVDDFSNQEVKQFKSKTNWGFEIVRRDESLNDPRWVRVICTGPDVTNDVQPGMLVLVEPLKWTEAFEHEQVEYWRTNDEFVLAIAEEE